MIKKPLILIVDDLTSNRLVIKKALVSNYDFIEAKNGVEALKLLSTYTPNIILIDAIMPEMNGFETITKVRAIQKFKRTPILMLSSLNDTKTKVKALGCGVNDFLTKPFDKYELRARCKSYIEISNLNRKYALSTQNPITKFNNEISLMRNLVPNDSIFLFDICDFYTIDSVYGYKNSKHIEKIFGNFLKEMANEYIPESELYHVNNGQFIIKVNKNNNYNNKEIELFCNEFHKNCKEFEINMDEMKYNPIATIIFVKDRINLYEDALSSLSYAKNNNLKYICLADDINGIKDIVHSNIEILKKVKNALENKKIINHYQPIYDNRNEKIVKYETLVRLENSDKSTMSPFFFLDIAKSGQLYEEITKTVFQNAFDMFKYNNLEFSINISYIDIAESSIRELIYNILQNNPHVSDRIIFEILEDEKIKDFGLFQEFISEVRKNGAQIAIDDFGSGYSNFQRIIDIKPDILKIDGSIVKNIIEDKNSYILLENINNFAHSFGMQTVAEFISSKEIFQEVSAMGIDFSQGYYIGEPALFNKEKELVLN